MFKALTETNIEGIPVGDCSAIALVGSHPSQVILWCTKKLSKVAEVAPVYRGSAAVAGVSQPRTGHLSPSSALNISVGPHCCPGALGKLFK
jgi:hypothetical protein